MACGSFPVGPHLPRRHGFLFNLTRTYTHVCLFLILAERELPFKWRRPWDFSNPHPDYFLLSATRLVVLFSTIAGPSKEQVSRFSNLPKYPARQYHARNMTNEVVKTCGGAAATSLSADRRNMAALLALVLYHLCIKMFWRSLYATIPQVEAEGWTNTFNGTALFLFCLDALVQVAFMETLQPISKLLDPEKNHLGCGAAFVAAYTLWFLPSATTMVEIFQVGTWVTFVFNVGCLAELRLGMFGKGMDELVDNWQAYQGARKA